MAKDIPIIFSGPMVRALLEGRKTMTRRLAWREVREDMILGDTELAAMEKKGWVAFDGADDLTTVGKPSPWQRVAIGDRLWVRENFAYVGTCDPGFLTYQATYPHDLAGLGLENVPAALKEVGYKWTPCIHMPRSASRLTLIVAGIKIEKLADISNADAILEGATARPACNGFEQRYDGWSMDWSEVGQFSKYATGGSGPLLERDISLASANSAFLGFINELHGGPRWNCNGKVPLSDQNPYIVALTFRVIKANIDAPETRLAA